MSVPTRALRRCVRILVISTAITGLVACMDQAPTGPEPRRPVRGETTDSGGTKPTCDTTSAPLCHATQPWG